MTLKAGDQVLEKRTGWVGTVVNQRLDEDIYKVHFERFISRADLELMSDVENELNKSAPQKWYSPERTAETIRLTALLETDLSSHDGKLSRETMESLRKLDLITEL